LPLPPFLLELLTPFSNMDLFGNPTPAPYVVEELATFCCWLGDVGVVGVPDRG